MAARRRLQQDWLSFPLLTRLRHGRQKGHNDPTGLFGVMYVLVRLSEHLGCWRLADHLAVSSCWADKRFPSGSGGARWPKIVSEHAGCHCDHKNDDRQR